MPISGGRERSSPYIWRLCGYSGLTAICLTCIIYLDFRSLIERGEVISRIWLPQTMTAIDSSQIQAGQKVRTDSLESVVTRFFVWAITRTWLATSEGAQAIIVRFGAHLVVGGLMVLAVVLSGVQLPPKVQAQFALPTPTPAVNLGNRVESLFSMRGGSRMIGG